jgi:hypothetical protein
MFHKRLLTFRNSDLIGIWNLNHHKIKDIVSFLKHSTWKYFEMWNLNISLMCFKGVLKGFYVTTLQNLA